MTSRNFPPGFLLGAATAAFQIEGAVDDDGRTPSIWDTFARVPGAVLGGDTGDVACDHYHRMPADVALMKELGLSSYRFSIAWPRVRPDGGAPNQKGIDFYSRLVDELLEADILPWVTLHHWDLPQALEDEGGWLVRDTAERFRDFALTTYDALGDRVRHWTTLNEPWCSAFLGYTGGQHAPGRQEGVAGVIAAHHLMLAHGLTIDELRHQGRADDVLGITLNLTVPEPFDPDELADVDAAERVDVFWNRIFLDPILLGRHARGLEERTAGMTWRGQTWQEFVRDGDLALIGAPLDVLGVNYYHGDAASGRPHPEPELLGSRIVHPPRPVVSPFPGGADITFPRRGLPVTGLDWEVQPEGLTRLLVRLRDEYDAPPIHVTENGAAYPDTVDADGRVHDIERRAFLADHLGAILDAIDAGVDVRGYFAWSLLDNFEWAYGYEQRFGIVHVDYETQERIVKDSGRWYADVARAGRLLDVPVDAGAVG
ncbi:glycoside hydrolase family 1 protein [Nocardioides caeni]|uniref:Glycosyl hydrolase family protein n=1 Tax=Nocardioides caeni TaxID=574700 RepID=A0A4S8N7A5_9ACTN|nr:family 1 glycosylhydrolase [Nocardioides caeni]THV12157.1 glycosyl hydrolase family protein [Nocardioides caeni]